MTSNLRPVDDPQAVKDTANGFDRAVEAFAAPPLAICGLGPGFDDYPKSWECWACAWGELAPRADILFEPHQECVWDMYGQTVERLNDYCKPIYMREPSNDIPLSRHLEGDLITEFTGERPQSTVAFMIAHAIMEQRDFGVFGVHMDKGSEYESQRANCRYLVGFARGKGLRVFIPPDSGLWDGGAVYSLGANDGADNL